MTPEELARWLRIEYGKNEFKTPIYDTEKKEYTKWLLTAKELKTIDRMNVIRIISYRKRTPANNVDPSSCFSIKR